MPAVDAGGWQHPAQAAEARAACAGEEGGEDDRKKWGQGGMALKLAPFDLDPINGS